MDLEIVILSEVSQTQKDKDHTILLICGILKKKGTNKPICKAEVESQMQKTNSGWGRGKSGDQFSSVQSLSRVRLFATP